MSRIQELANITGETFSISFPTYNASIYGISVVHSGTGYSFDIEIEVTNDACNSSEWGPRPDTTFIGVTDSGDSPVIWDFQSGLGAARIRIFNVAGTIDNLFIDINNILRIRDN